LSKISTQIWGYFKWSKSFIPGYSSTKFSATRYAIYFPTVKFDQLFEKMLVLGSCPIVTRESSSTFYIFWIWTMCFSNSLFSIDNALCTLAILLFIQSKMVISLFCIEVIGSAVLSWGNIITSTMKDSKWLHMWRGPLLHRSDPYLMKHYPHIIDERWHKCFCSMMSTIQCIKEAYKVLLVKRVVDTLFSKYPFLQSILSLLH